MPTTPPAAHGPPPKLPASCAACRPGMTSENALAASITPAPKPNRLSCTRSDKRCENSTGSVPSAVASAATEPPISALCTTGLPWMKVQLCMSRTSAPAT